MHSLKLKKQTFPAKLLLFGEYCAMIGGEALAIPWQRYSGYLDLPSTFTAVCPHLQALADYLQQNPLAYDWRYEDFFLDVRKGLSFLSTIPQGQGLGSSGALCAALHQRYSLAKQDTEKNELSYQDLKQQLSELELFFHGKSSGLDPLISYIQEPLLQNSSGKLSIVSMPSFSSRCGWYLALVNTQRARKTGPLVQKFLLQMQRPHYELQINQKLIPINQRCIQLLLNEGLTSHFKDAFAELSQVQWDLLHSMIPQEFVDIWQESGGQNVYMKLCGAGGGGYLLALTDSLTKLEQIFASYPYEVINEH